MCFWKRRKKYRCLCCGKKTLPEKPPGTYEICPVCGWEDDRAQAEDEDLAGGANELSLREYRLRYKERKRSV
ncbi:MAG: hydrolase [Lachnospiraceae bacterium]|nr:hydrolase [Lachnospiraceae bacterium]